MGLTELIKNGVVITNLEGDCKEEVFKGLYNELYKQGKVKESFYEGLIKREEVFPTGLLLTKHNVAIPHTDVEHVNSSCIAVATLKNPVTFQCMEDSDKSLEIRIVFMLAMAEAHSHIEMLQKLIMLIQNEVVLENILRAQNKNEVIEQINQVYESLSV
ncbi:PTS sugar transporter subunit IIA [Clostridium magnum]|uniref:PTS system fructose-specific EIIABC component n=1 Tax=Clostridium magnum DSM 2767 TaxID=1121326 RepID=A0A161YHW6_9CLOT|nr:PTS sugar transporter subunit IIA [Clostridium magnum]KZL89882.1 PTS system fructose-specific EIIABC component [Clostridium magnum DSM 2767]SHI46872.1 PTS system IIA component, Gat family (TC 4.A.5) [Clostridium magnum DSM 2767]